jgi:hypothetical protein
MCRISWDPARRSAYGGSLHSSLAQSGLRARATAATHGDFDGSDRVLSSVLQSCALIAGARSSCPGQSAGRCRRPNHAPFLDGECHRAHKRYWRARRLAISAGGFQAEERRYKALIRRKQLTWQMQQLQRHLTDLHRDPRVLWRTFNVDRATLPTTLPGFCFAIALLTVCLLLAVLCLLGLPCQHLKQLRQLGLMTILSLMGKFMLCLQVCMMDGRQVPPSCQQSICATPWTVSVCHLPLAPRHISRFIFWCPCCRDCSQALMYRKAGRQHL